MKRNRTLLAALALTLSSCPLFAQDNQPNPQQRPPQPPQGEGGPRREGAPGGGQRHAPGLFGALDANHDGVIDAEEISHAADILRKLDRNGDGKITPDEITPQGEGRRPQAGGENRGPQADGRREQGPRGEGRADGPRREGVRSEGERGPRPEGEARREGDRQRGPAPEGPRAAGPRDGERAPGAPRGGELRREGPQGPPPGEAPQAQHRGHRHAPWMHDGQDRFAQNPRPDFGRGGPRPPWESGALRGEGGPQGPMAMGPRMEARQRFGREGFDPREFRAFRNELSARGPQGGPGQFHPPHPGMEPQGPMHRPNFDGPRGGPQPQAPGAMHRPEGMHDGRGEFGPRGPQDGPGQFRPPGAGMERQGPGPRPSFDGPSGGPEGRGPGEFRHPEGPRDGRGDRGPQAPRDEREPRPQGPRPPDVQ